MTCGMESLRASKDKPSFLPRRGCWFLFWDSFCALSAHCSSSTPTTHLGSLRSRCIVCSFLTDFYSLSRINEGSTALPFLFYHCFFPPRSEVSVSLRCSWLKRWERFEVFLFILTVTFYFYLYFYTLLCFFTSFSYFGTMDIYGCFTYFTDLYQATQKVSFLKKRYFLSFLVSL